MPYTPPALNAVNFEFQAYTVPGLAAVNFEFAPGGPVAGQKPRRTLLGVGRSLLWWLWLGLAAGKGTVT